MFISFDVMGVGDVHWKATIMFGSKSSTHLSKIMNLSRNSPTDPMHQIVLVIGKISKFLTISRKGQLMQRAVTLVTGVEVTFDSQQRTKSLSDIQF